MVVNIAPTPEELTAKAAEERRAQNSVMMRAVIGFFILNLALLVLCVVGLYVATNILDSYWMKVVVGIGGFIAEFGIYFSTIHEPIYDWIRAPRKGRY